MSMCLRLTSRTSFKAIAFIAPFTLSACRFVRRTMQILQTTQCVPTPGAIQAHARQQFPDRAIMNLELMTLWPNSVEDESRLSPETEICCLGRVVDSKGLRILGDFEFLSEEVSDGDRVLHFLASATCCHFAAVTRACVPKHPWRAPRSPGCGGPHDRSRELSDEDHCGACQWLGLRVSIVWCC